MTVGKILRAAAVAGDAAIATLCPSSAVSQANSLARFEEGCEVLEPGQLADLRRRDCPPWTIAGCVAHGLVTIVRPGEGCPKCFPPTGGQ
ncbi:hypothetical protein H7J86_24150 [Mycobacterium hackensackense]|uniref:hypothetical protein n=1 Tax=Mycobacterium hackensackense TaxID=228909 RepID=UPI002265F25B|nr:hypothetical protein [Mycobacterium hackensackense]MCV7255259.1 hypothetical protein [Mycobacterium hackensackense]